MNYSFEPTLRKRLTTAIGGNAHRGAGEAIDPSRSSCADPGYLHMTGTFNIGRQEGFRLPNVCHTCRVDGSLVVSCSVWGRCFRDPATAVTGVLGPTLVSDGCRAQSSLYWVISRMAKASHMKSDPSEKTKRRNRLHSIDPSHLSWIDFEQSVPCRLGNEV
jgi:hypothetical protein